jgi:hypothetical protein
VRPQIQVTAYVIHTDLDPASGHMTATAEVTFKALEDLNAVVFGLNNGLQVTSITDPSNAKLVSERNVTDSTIRVTPAAILPKGSTSTWTFTYAGAPTVDTSPVDGIRFAQIADPVSILLYPGRWFPIAMPGLFTDRFTAQIAVTVPTGRAVVGSGVAGKRSPRRPHRVRLQLDQARLPRHHRRGQVRRAHHRAGHPQHPRLPHRAQPGQGQGLRRHRRARVRVHDRPVRRRRVRPAGRRRAAHRLRLRRLGAGDRRHPPRPRHRPPAGQHRRAPVVGLGGLPATLNDAWITNGMSRYAELMYLEDASGKTAFQTAITDVEAGAFAYDTEPLTTLGRLDPFSPQFQSMTLEKGAMVFHMLRWEMGDDVFTKFLRSLSAVHRQVRPHRQRADRRRGAVQPQPHRLLLAVAGRHRRARVH